MAASSSSINEASQEEMTLNVKWVGKEYVVRVCADDTVGELKRRICELTNVLPKRQKLLNLKMGSKPADDSVFLSQLSIKPNLKIMMLGTVEDEILVEPVDAPEIVDDFEFEEIDSQDIKDREMHTLNPPREGKRLLVLDIDYTLFDHRSSAENPHELMRPYLHEFLTAAYAEYDIIIWSATSMKWVEVKMKELGVLNNPDYKITALLDHLAMISVQSQSHGVFDCKPLGLIWGKFPEFYNPGNTIMFDDLKRNFVMNPQNGLVIRPFRKAHLNRGIDQELVGLSLYLLAIADLDNFQSLDHSRWEKFVQRNTKRRTS
ncbi:hypothetical protein GOP47_0002293 [Adiantum capillus-veneris]|uniref:protein-serine/threonine phosphatase n=1 Tax=Adiantum capillus-veneris TaxID=13818 RepID=A0A9D4VAP3_ADICA|nr:hypothetical protein GOP47_0002293 [Adiantum capillus-veneris]